MSATLTTPPRPADLARASAGARRPTLEQTLEGAWRAARAGNATECPLCREAMTFSAGEAECSGCGSRLS